jgi:hypothetical protein
VRHGDAGVIVRSSFCDGSAWESVWCLTDAGLIDGCAGRDRGGITSGSGETGILRFGIRIGGDGSRRCEEDGVQRRVMHGVVSCDEERETNVRDEMVCETVFTKSRNRKFQLHPAKLIL